MRWLHEGLWHGCGAQTCPILCTCLPSFLSWVMSPRHVLPLPCYGSFVAASEYFWTNGVFRHCMRGLRGGMMAYAWYIGMPPPRPLVNRPSSSALCLPQHASLPCLASFVAACEYGCEIDFVGNACEGCGRGCCMGVVHRPAPSCALPTKSISQPYSHAATGEFGWARVVLAARAPAAT